MAKSSSKKLSLRTFFFYNFFPTGQSRIKPNILPHKKPSFKVLFQFKTNLPFLIMLRYHQPSSSLDTLTFKSRNWPLSYQILENHQNNEGKIQIGKIERLLWYLRWPSMGELWKNKVKSNVFKKELVQLSNHLSALEFCHI